MGLIFWFSSQPSLPSLKEGWLDLLMKKSAHAFVYFVLLFLWYSFFKTITNFSRIKILMLSFILTAIYAIVDEWHQSFVPNRNPTYFDVLIDLTGAIIAIIIIFIFSKMQGNFSKQD